jgi:threonine dehydrogenase-like Zn-dependent dehydrogenase
MRAAVMRNRQLLVDEVAAPVPGEGEVLVKTLACGICGSDLHFLKHLDRMIDFGRRTRPQGPHIDPAGDVVMGHEFCAEIVDHGPGTQKALPVGARVCSMPVALGPAGISTIGYSHDHPGGYGELMVLSEALCLPVPADLATDLAALTEPLAVGRHAVEMARLGPEDVPLVIGCGPVGLAVIAALKMKGAGPVVAADFSPGRRRLAEAMGADEVIDPAADSPYERWQDLCWPPGADRTGALVELLGPKPKPAVAVECVGVPGVINALFEGTMRGNRIVVVGVCMEADHVEPMLGIGKELNVQFVLGYTPAEFTDTLAALADGRLKPEPMITGKVGVDGVPDAFGDLADPEQHAKILVEPWR